MRIDKNKIINGFVSYVENEVIPKMADDKATQIIISIMVNTLKTNTKQIDKILENEMVKSAIKHEVIDGKETYDIDGIIALAQSSVSKYGYFPITLPAVPFISPTEKQFKFNSDDIEMLRTYIEEAK